MRLTLDVQQDEQLRDTVRAHIKLRVDNIVRSELPKIIDEVVRARIAENGYSVIDRVVTQEYRRAIESRAKAAAGKPMPELIRQIVAELFVDRFGTRKAAE